MSPTRLFARLGLIVVPLSGCAINPVPVSALPGPNKDQAAFTKDETFCRTAAARAAYQNRPGPQGEAGQPVPHSANVNVTWQEYFTSYGQCESARGNIVQPVPWGVAYQLYLGYGLPYPGVIPYPVGYPPMAAYPYPPPYGYP